MTDHNHAIVWIDHREAKIFNFDAAAVDKVIIPSHLSGHHLQHKANTTGSGHLGVDKEFFQRVSTALTHTGDVLITGPGNAKHEFKNHISQHRPDLRQRIAGVAALDHPTDNQLVALARKFFKVNDELQAS